MDRHGGGFPHSAAEIATLPGIGRSTAAAIAAFAYDERAAILDGNVKRVLCRVFGIEGFPGEKAVENRLWALAESLLPERGIGVYIQAQMDLGATLCSRGKPACGRCPLHDDCVARREGRVAELPAARPRKAVPRRSVRVAVVVRNGTVLLERRPPTGIWGGLLALPEVPEDAADVPTWAGEALGLRCDRIEALAPLTHTFTHFILDMQPLRLHAADTATQAREDRHVWQPIATLAEAALPTPVRRILAALTAPDLFTGD